MVKMQYRMTIFYDLKDPADPDYWDCQNEIQYYDTIAEAEQEAAKHPKGQVEGYYGDGVECIVSDVIIEYEPECVEYID